MCPRRASPRAFVFHTLRAACPEAHDLPLPCSRRHKQNVCGKQARREVTVELITRRSEILWEKDENAQAAARERGRAPARWRPSAASSPPPSPREAWHPESRPASSVSLGARACASGTANPGPHARTSERHGPTMAGRHRHHHHHRRAERAAAEIMTKLLCLRAWSLVETEADEPKRLPQES